MINKPLIRWLVLLNVLVLGGILFTGVIRQQNRQRQRAAEHERVVVEDLKQDTISLRDYHRLEEVGDAAWAGKPLTNAELSFLLTGMTQSYNGQVSSMASGLAAMSLRSIKKPLPASQKEIVYRSLTPLLSAADTYNGPGITLTQRNKIYACSVLAHLGIREAAPSILPLLDDPNQQIRNRAQRALQQLGYTPS